MLTGSVTAAQRSAAAGALLACAPLLAQAQSSPFMTGATALQTNILAWADAHRRHPGDGARRHGDGQPHCPGVFDLRERGGPNNCRELRQHPDPALLGSEHGGTSQLPRASSVSAKSCVSRPRARGAPPRCYRRSRIPAPEHRVCRHGFRDRAAARSRRNLKLASNPAWVRGGLRPVAAARATAAPATARGAGRILPFPGMRCRSLPPAWPGERARARRVRA